MMGRAARFNANDHWFHIGEEPNHLRTSQFTAKYRLLILVYSVNLKDLFRRIHADANGILHGNLLCLSHSAPSLTQVFRKGPSTPSVVNAAVFAPSKGRRIGNEL